MISIGLPKDGKPTPPDTDDEQPDLDEQQDDNRAVPPEAVCCHTAQEACSNCEYADEQMFCSWLKQQVGDDSPGGIIYCRLFEAKGGSEPDADDSGGPPDTDSDDAPPGMR